MLVKKSLGRFLAYSLTRVGEKYEGDKHLKNIKSPAQMCLISFIVLAVISSVKTTFKLVFNIEMIPIALLIVYDNYIKTYINLVSSSNLKETVLQNFYMILACLIFSRILNHKYNKKQYFLMFNVFILAVIQVLIPENSNVINIGPRDFANFFGSVCDVLATILFKIRLEKQLGNSFNYTFSLSIFQVFFACLFISTDFYSLTKQDEITYDIPNTLIVIIFSTFAQLFFNLLKFQLEPYVFVIVVRFVNFVAESVSDYYNGNTFNILQLTLGFSSVLLCNMIVFLDAKPNDL
ncbi:hypothetical protein NUSPORA_01731 [Nucleospora cyclopteri]